MTIRVLFVDDEQELLNAVCEFINQTEPKVEVVIANSAKTALELIEGNGIEAIISDYKMDFMDGLKLLELVRTKNKTIPFIIFTRHSREEVAIKALNLGATFYLKKESSHIKAQFHELCKLVIHAVEKRRCPDHFTGCDQKYGHEDHHIPLWLAGVPIDRVCDDGNIPLAGTAYLRHCGMHGCEGCRHAGGD